MFNALVTSYNDPLTHDPEAVGELVEAWDIMLDTSSVEGDFEDWYDGGGVV